MSGIRHDYSIKDGVLVTRYKDITNFFEIATSKIYYTDKSGSTAEDRIIKHIQALKNPKIECTRVFSTEVEGMSVGCADTCNLACTYCYANAGTYNSSCAKKIMDKAVFNELFNYLVNLPKPVQTLTFFGGEPFLAFKDIKDFIPKLNEAYTKKFNTVPLYSAITNGTIISGEMADFLNRHFTAISISIDGPKHICDTTRVFCDPAKSVYEAIKNTMQAVNKEKRNYFLAALATLTPETMIQAQAIGAKEFRRSFFDLGFDQVAIFEASGIPWPQKALQAAYRFYEDITDETFEILTEKRTDIPPDEDVMALLFNILKQHYRGDCTAGKSYFYYTIADGVYPCQLYYNEKKRNCRALRRKDIVQCRICPALNVCSSHCGGTALSENGDENTPRSMQCTITLFKLELVLKRLAYYAFHKDTTNAYKNIIEAVKNFARNNAVSQKYKSAV